MGMTGCTKVHQKVKYKRLWDAGTDTPRVIEPPECCAWEWFTGKLVHSHYPTLTRGGNQKSTIKKIPYIVR